MALRNSRLSADVVHDRGRRLQVTATNAADLEAFEGEITTSEGKAHLDGPLSAANAAALRAEFANLRPALLGARRSIGTGDRLGLATPGHVRAFQRFGSGVAPVFAQQSIREMDRLDRDVQSVLDDATFGCVEAGWEGVVGADTDHIKTEEGIDRGLAAGFTMFTLDPGDEVIDPDSVTGNLDDHVPWRELEDDEAALLRRYSGKRVDIGAQSLVMSDEDVRRAAVKYGKTIARTMQMARHLLDNAGREVEIEVAVDETDLITSFIEHYYLAAELQRLGLQWVSLAPRYVDGFEKGVEFLGDTADLEANLRGHTAIANQFGEYKISLHSGSDKFSIYPLAAEATGGRVHLKTSGTSYLCALDVAAIKAPDLVRDMYRVCRESYRQARASYQVSADLSKTPDPSEVADESMPGLVTEFDTRQILHVGYGDVLTHEDGSGNRPYANGLREVLEANPDLYSDVLVDHIGKHVAPFANA